MLQNFAKQKNLATYIGPQCTQRAICGNAEYLKTEVGISRMIKSSRHRSISNFSYKNYQTVKQTSEENEENHQLSDTVLIYHQILRRDLKRPVWVSVLRIKIMNMELKGVSTYFELSSLCILFDSRIWRFLSLSSFSNSI